MNAIYGELSGGGIQWCRVAGGQAQRLLSGLCGAAAGKGTWSHPSTFLSDMGRAVRTLMPWYWRGTRVRLGAAVAKTEWSVAVGVGRGLMFRVRVAFVFPGQGAQWVRVGCGLLQESQGGVAGGLPGVCRVLDPTPGRVSRCTGCGARELRVRDQVDV